jgi:hypothetical protein
VKFRLGCKIAHENLKPRLGELSRWRETYSMFQLEFPRPKWGVRLFWVHCPLCGKKLLLSLTSWPIKISSAVLCVGIYGFFVLKALYLHEQGDNIPESLSYILIFGACVLSLCLALSLSRGPGIIHPLGGRLAEPMHTIDHKYTQTN